jgi:hypothetical protein
MGIPALATLPERFAMKHAYVWSLVFLGFIPQPAAAQAPLRERIDERVAEAWREQRISPASPASDAEFLRRVYLDLVGVIPTYEETIAFLDDPDAEKRAKLIDRLLDDPRFSQHQADIWDLILFGRNPPGYDTDKRDGIQRWLREQFAQNRPYDAWVRELLKAEGNSVDQGPPLYYVQYKNQPEDLTEVVTQTFLGVQLQCARCHDHPYEPWSQEDFFGAAAFFARLMVVTVGKKDKLTQYAIGEKSTGDVLFTGPVQEQTPGKKGEPVKPRFLTGESLDEPPLPDDFKEVKFESNKPPPPPVFSRKDQFAEWATAPDNPFFARAIANRLWAQLMGRGLVHPVDNMSPSNDASHPELLDELTAWMVEHGFDLKAYFRELANSETYQLSSAGGSGEAAPQWFQHARSRPLTAEELTASWRTATGYDAAVTDDKRKDDRYRPLTSGYVLRFFGRPNNGVGDFQGGLHEHLYLNNGQLGSVIVSAPGSLLDAMLQEEKSWEERVERLFLQSLNRPPTAEERQWMVEFLSEDSDPRRRVEDAIWALITCSEFRFNH